MWSQELERYYEIMKSSDKVLFFLMWLSDWFYCTSPIASTLYPKLSCPEGLTLSVLILSFISRGKPGDFESSNLGATWNVCLFWLIWKINIHQIYSLLLFVIYCQLSAIKLLSIYIIDNFKRLQALLANIVTTIIVNVRIIPWSKAFETGIVVLILDSIYFWKYIAI